MYELFRPGPLPLLSAGHAAPGPYFGARMGRRKGLLSRLGLPDSAGGWGSGMTSLTARSDERAPSAFARFGRADSERAFRAAVRHSRHVRILRVAIPLTAIIALVTGVAFALLLNPLRMLSGMPVDLGRMVVSGTKIMMHQPRLAGVTRDKRRYDMVAQAAAQDRKSKRLNSTH